MERGSNMDPSFRWDDETSNAVAIKKIRSQLGEDMALGITCHASRHLAMEAAEAGADYVAFGAFYPTTSKPMEKLREMGHANA